MGNLEREGSIDQQPRNFTDKMTLAAKIYADTLIPQAYPMNKRIDGYSQRVRADVRRVRSIVGFGVVHPAFIYLFAHDGIQNWGEAVAVGINLVPYMLTGRYVRRPQRLKQLVPTPVRKLSKRF